jgi:type II secretory pathway component PulF
MPIDPLDHSVTEALRAWRVQHNAGIDVTSTLTSCATLCREPAAKESFQNAAQQTQRGGDIAGILNALRPTLSEAERAVINAGWQSGRVESVLDAVVEQRELWATARTKIRSQLVLPAFILLFASFIAPVPAFIAGKINFIGYALSAGTPLLVAYVLWRLLERALANRSNRLDAILLAIPLLSRIEKARCLSEFASVLSILVGAGTSISIALEICARAATNTLYRDEILRCMEIVKTGNPLSSAMRAGAYWPHEFIAAVNVGEQTGTLDESLKRLGKQLRDRYTDAVEQLAAWIPRILYGLVALFVIVQIALLVLGLAAAYNSVLN